MSLVKSRFIGYVIGVYVLAKIAEIFDPEIFALLGGAISGHSIKHLLAALGPVAIIAMMCSWPETAAMEERQPGAGSG